MTLSEFIFKAKYKLRFKIVSKLRGKKIYPLIYISYWHFLLSSKPIKKDFSNTHKIYFSAQPNIFAGIGHQMANWIAGYWFASQFKLNFAHIPFSSKEWEELLGFGQGEITVSKLVASHGYQKIMLPLFDEDNNKDILRTKNIINSYHNKKVIFIVEQDQFYRDQIGVIEQIKKKFHSANSRSKDQLIYQKENFNIAIHVRRGDILKGLINKNPNHLMRFQDNSYFENVLANILSNFKIAKPIVIYLFSQGQENDFKNFEKFNNVQYCLKMNPQDSFLHMVFADLLITSKSSFSYKPALLSNGIKICPKSFWHGYPQSENWILVEEDGTFNL